MHCALALLLLAGVSSGQWTQNEELRRWTSTRAKAPPKHVVVNLDLAPVDRWSFLAKDTFFANFKADYRDYISTYVPKIVLPLVTNLVKHLQKAYYPDYVEEMHGIATALNLTVGDVVLINLIYQVEHLGATCEVRNVTGPCPPKKDKAPGLCTGIVANGQSEKDLVWQGRNLDWNLDAKLLKYVMQVDYQKSGKTLFTGVQITGEIGSLHGMRKGSFSVQMNARDEGGDILPNLFEQMLLGGKTPTHVIRRAMETSSNAAAAEVFLSTEKLANPVYFLVAGSHHGEGAILTRDRSSLLDAWHLNQTSTKDKENINHQPSWLRLQTNYDHWEKVPSYDDRRTPGVANMIKGCSGGVDAASILKVLTTWPTQNHHTDVTTVMCPSTGYIETIVWLAGAERVSEHAVIV